MEDKYIWPLIGVVLGWLLTNLSSQLKDREESRRKVAKLLAKFIVLHRQLLVTKTTTAKLEDSCASPEEYERLRQRVFDKSLLPSEIQLSNIESAIDELSGIYPLFALDLEEVMRTIVKHKNVKLSESASNIKIYSLLSATHELGINTCINVLEKDIRKLAFKHGLVTYLKVRMHFKKLAVTDSGIADEIIKQVQSVQPSS